MSLHCVSYYFWAGITTDVLFPFIPGLLTVGQHVAIGTAVDKFHVFPHLLLYIFPFRGTSLETFFSKLSLYFLFVCLLVFYDTY